jgi:hypothetical protein
MSKRILLLAIGAVLLFGNTRVFADSIKRIAVGPEDSIGISYWQTSMEKDLEYTSPAGINGGDFSINPKNDTAKNWGDYLFVIRGTGLKLGKITGTGFSKFTPTAILNKNGVAVGEKILCTGGIVPYMSEKFTASFNLTWTKGTTTKIWGTPSLKAPLTTPEPSSLWLMGTGLLALAPVIRRKLRM